MFFSFLSVPYFDFFSFSHGDICFIFMLVGWLVGPLVGPLVCPHRSEATRAGGLELL
jgi:hypothetical protein